MDSQTIGHLKSPLSPEKVGAQLYTVRAFTKTGAEFRTTLERISAIGYRSVQISAAAAVFADSPEVDARQTAEWLGEFGLTCSATHRPFEALMENVEREIDWHSTVGCKLIAIGGLPGKFQADFGVDKLLDEFDSVRERYSQAGISLGIHNHSVDFRSISQGLEGRPDYWFEMDVYWAAHAGADLAATFAAFKGRCPAIHVKDAPHTPSGADWTLESPARYEAVGEGRLDWDWIIPEAEDAGVEWYLVEQDETPRDPFDCLASSFRYLTGQ